MAPTKDMAKTVNTRPLTTPLRAWTDEIRFNISSPLVALLRVNDVARFALREITLDRSP
jgi:hypothetical protein